MTFSHSFDEAFDMLEQSFNNESFLRAYEALPEKGDRASESDNVAGHIAVDVAESDEHDTGEDGKKDWRLTTNTAAATAPAADADTNTDSDSDSDSDGSMHQGFGGTRSFPRLSFLHRSLPVRLPPTPPTQSPDITLPTLVTAANHTPTTVQSPLTPELTPPFNRNRSTTTARSLFLRNIPNEISRSESFVTAREELGRDVASTQQGSLLSLGSARSRGRLDSRQSSGGSDGMEPVCEPRVADAHKTAARERRPSDASLHRPSYESWPEAVNDLLYNHLRNNAVKRFSSTSNDSTVVEAMVKTPPERRQSLRHAGTNLALREEMSQRRVESESSEDRPSIPTESERSASATESRVHTLQSAKPNTALLNADGTAGRCRPSLDSQIVGHALRWPTGEVVSDDDDENEDDDGDGDDEPLSDSGVTARLVGGHFDTASARSSGSFVTRLSDRTDMMEISQAQAANVYPHPGRFESELETEKLIRRKPVGSSAAPATAPSPLQSRSSNTSSETKVAPVPRVSAFTEVTTPRWSMIDVSDQDVSPLGYPRRAPQPPVIQFIPATPRSDQGEVKTGAGFAPMLAPLLGNDEVAGEHTPPPTLATTQVLAPMSVMQRARRYSGSFIQPLIPRRVDSRFQRQKIVQQARTAATYSDAPVKNATNTTDTTRAAAARRRAQSAVDQRDVQHLSPFWRPRNVWSGPRREGAAESDTDTDTEDEYEYEYDPKERYGRTPAARGRTTGAKRSGSVSLGIGRAGLKRGLDIGASLGRRAKKGWSLSARQASGGEARSRVASMPVSGRNVNGRDELADAALNEKNERRRNEEWMARGWLTEGGEEYRLQQQRERQQKEQRRHALQQIPPARAQAGRRMSLKHVLTRS